MLAASAASLWLLAASAAAATVSKDELVYSRLQLRANYNKLVRPSPDTGTANLVSISLILHKLLDLDEVNQMISVSLWMSASWNDSRLSWENANSSEIGNVSLIYLPLSELWVPDLTVLMAAEIRTSDKKDLVGTVSRSGLVTMETPYVTKTPCKLAMWKFPFDSQRCSFSIGSPAVQKDALRITSSFEQGPNFTCSEFCLTLLSATIQLEAQLYESAVYTVGLRRKPLFYVVNLIVPCGLILLIALLGFLLPPDSGERMSLNVTIVLSMTVFLQQAASYSPTQSETVPVLTWFFTSAIGITTAGTLANIFVLYCHSCSEKHQPLTNALLRLLYYRCSGSAGHKVSVSNEIPCSPLKLAAGGGEAASFQESLLATLRQIYWAVALPISDESRGVEWRNIGSRVNLACFVVLSAFVCFVTVAMVAVATSSVEECLP